MQPQLELVWTGPEAGLRPARDTAVVDRREILEPFHRAMADRGVEATFFLNIERAPDGHDPARHAAATSTGENWPFGNPRPAVIYDPQTSSPARSRVCTLSASSSMGGGRWSTPPTLPTAASTATSKPAS